MELELPLDRMTLAEKLSAVDRIWEDICRHPEEIPSPEWHGEELRERERLVKEGLLHFSDWEEAKRRIRDSTK
jgi:hypothetical protein